MAASASKKASNTPAWLKRQKRFHTEFQFPHAAGRARQVMLWTQKSCTASRKIRSFRPLAPRRERQARNTSSTVAQSSSVIRVSMVGSSQTDLPSVTDPRTWESTHCILSPIRPHGLKLRACSIALDLSLLTLMLSLSPLRLSLAPLPYSSDSNRGEYSDRCPRGPNSFSVLAVVLAHQPAEIKNAADWRCQLSHGL